ncbi:hypothetical protein HK102_006877, partial [Quaeritorhiza haematococci]
MHRLIELICNDGRDHFYIANSKFGSPEFGEFVKVAREGGVGVSEEYLDSHCGEGEGEGKGKEKKQTDPPVSFGTFKPDYLEVWISRPQEEGDDTIIKWRVIDAKPSRFVKVSHQVQMGFYWLSLRILFENYLQSRKGASSSSSSSSWRVTGEVGPVSFEFDTEGHVWFPTPGHLLGDQPDTSSRSVFSFTLLEPLLLRFLTTQLPNIMRQPERDVPWHFNPLCSGCEFEETCRGNAVSQKKISVIPHVSIAEHRVLLQCVEVGRSQRSQGRSSSGGGSGGGGSEIEELHRLFHRAEGVQSDFKSVVDLISHTLPTTYDKLQRILAIPSTNRNGIKLLMDNIESNAVSVEDCDVQESPVLRSALKGTVEIIDRPTLAFPRSEDIAVYISILVDPETDLIFSVSITTVSYMNKTDTNTENDGQQQHQQPTITSSETLLSSYGVDEWGMGKDRPTEDPNAPDRFAVSVLAALARVIESLLDEREKRVKGTAHAKLRVQFYVYGNSEKMTLTQLIIDQALRLNPTAASPGGGGEPQDDGEVFADEEHLRLCIGGLLDQSEVLLTTFQPEIFGTSELIRSSVTGSGMLKSQLE